MNEINIPSEMADSVYEISKRTDLSPDSVGNIAISMGLCSLHRGTLPSSGGGGASRPRKHCCRIAVEDVPEVQQV